MYANVASGKSQSDALNVLKNIAKATLPEGYHINLSGSSKTSEESSSALIITFALGIVVAYMVLGSQYNSFIHPVVVLMALPFSVTGAFIALWLGGKSINLYSMIGLILLMGIVKKNSILLVDFTNERRKDGLSVREALLEACPIRLRPIIMTSIATVSAAIPTAPKSSLGAGSETRVPMAFVIIGGVSVSTLLTLFVVPAFYLFMSRFESSKHEDSLQEALRELGEIPVRPNRFVSIIAAWNILQFTDCHLFKDETPRSCRGMNTADSFAAVAENRRQVPALAAGSGARHRRHFARRVRTRRIAVFLSMFEPLDVSDFLFAGQSRRARPKLASILLESRHNVHTARQILTRHVAAVAARSPPCYKQNGGFLRQEELNFLDQCLSVHDDLHTLVYACTTT